MLGVTRWFNAQKGYGFVKPDDGTKDVFVHANSLQKSQIPPLKEGQRVEFSIVAGRKGNEAVNIKLV